MECNSKYWHLTVTSIIELQLMNFFNFNFSQHFPIIYAHFIFFVPVMNVMNVWSIHYYLISSLKNYTSCILLAAWSMYGYTLNNLLYYQSCQMKSGLESQFLGRSLANTFWWLILTLWTIYNKYLDPISLPKFPAYSARGQNPK